MNFDISDSLYLSIRRSYFQEKQNILDAIININNRRGCLTYVWLSDKTSSELLSFPDDVFIIFLYGMPAGMQTLFFNQAKSPWCSARMRRTFLSAGHDHTMRKDVPIRREMSVGPTMISRRGGRLPYHLLSFPGMPGNSRRTYDLFPPRQNISVRFMTTSRRGGRLPYHLLSFPAVANDSRKAYAPLRPHGRKRLPHCYDLSLFNL